MFSFIIVNLHMIQCRCHWTVKEILNWFYIVIGNYFSRFEFYSWVILILYVFSNIGVGMTMMTCGTIAPILTKEYGISTLLVNMCSLSFLLMFVPGNFATIFVMSRYGFRVCVRTRIILNNHIDHSWRSIYCCGLLG